VPKERLIVVGGDAAGMSAASVARRRRPDLEIVVFEKGDFTSYAACGIPYYASGQIEKAESLIARTPEEFRKATIDVRMRSEVVAIDLAARRVQARDLVSGHQRLLREPARHGHNVEGDVGGRGGIRILEVTVAREPVAAALRPAQKKSVAVACTLIGAPGVKWMSSQS
jgi:hypothetical protein